VPIACSRSSDSTRVTTKFIDILKKRADPTPDRILAKMSCVEPVARVIMPAAIHERMKPIVSGTRYPILSEIYPAGSSMKIRLKKKEDIITPIRISSAPSC